MFSYFMAFISHWSLSTLETHAREIEPKNFISIWQLVDDLKIPEFQLYLFKV
jgi:hypothetical protein